MLIENNGWLYNWNHWRVGFVEFVDDQVREQALRRIWIDQFRYQATQCFVTAVSISEYAPLSEIMGRSLLAPEVCRHSKFITLNSSIVTLKSSCICWEHLHSIGLARCSTAQLPTLATWRFLLSMAVPSSRKTGCSHSWMAVFVRVSVSLSTYALLNNFSDDWAQSCLLWRDQYRGDLGHPLLWQNRVW
jgi:hypothetical protein